MRKKKLDPLWRKRWLHDSLVNRWRGARGTPDQVRAKRVALLGQFVENQWDLSARGLIGQLLDNEASEREPLALALVVTLAKHGKYKRARVNLAELGHIMKNHETQLAALLHVYRHSHAAQDRDRVRACMGNFADAPLARLLIYGISGTYSG